MSAEFAQNVLSIKSTGKKTEPYLGSCTWTGVIVSLISDPSFITPYLNHPNLSPAEFK